jgi:hypothetical protein
VSSVRTISPEAEPTRSAAPPAPATPYHYFVSWGYPSGIGNCEMAMARPITELDDVRLMERWLKGQGVNQPSITNWILLRVDGSAVASGGAR